jgi:hypothetical protein
MSFLNLPLELRFQIYGITADPSIAPFSEYQGLYLSCRQIKDEMDTELPRATNAHLARITALLPPGVTISASGTLPAPLNVRVTLDRSMYPSSPRTCLYLNGEGIVGVTPWDNFLQNALGLHVESLTLAFKTRGATEMYHQANDPNKRWRIHTWLANVFRSRFHSTNARRVIVELDMYDIGVRENTYYTKSGFSNRYRKGWKHRWSGKIGDGDGCFMQLIWGKVEELEVFLKTR